MTNGNDYAFPQAFEKGLTKREYFAAIALQGLASMDNKGADMDQVIETDAFLSVKYADALIKALNEKP